MTYEFKCFECDSFQEVEINTSDMLGRFGVVDQDKLEEEKNKKRTCYCGGDLRKVFSKSAPIFFEGWISGKNGSRWGNLTYNKNPKGKFAGYG